jgi:hypothetical protein
MDKQPEYLTSEEMRLLEVMEQRLSTKFGPKRRFKLKERAAIHAELVAAGLDAEQRRNPDAVEAVFRELNAIDEVAAARRALGMPLAR